MIIQTTTNRCINLDSGYSIFFEGDWERKHLIQMLSDMADKDPSWEPSWLSISNPEWNDEEFQRFHRNLNALRDKIMEEKSKQYLD